MSTLVHALRSKIGTLEKRLDELLKRVEELEVRPQIVLYPLTLPVIGPFPIRSEGPFTPHWQPVTPIITIGDDPNYVGPTCSAKAGL